MWFAALFLFAHVQTAQDTALTKFVDRACTALLKSDWESFRKEAAPFVSIEFHVRLDDPAVAPGYTFVMRRDMDSRSVANISVVKNEATISKRDAKWFKEFCEGVKDSYESRQSHSYGWRDIQSTYSKYEYDGLVVSEPHFSGIIASNMEFIVTFGKEDGRYVCKRLILDGH